MRTALVFGASGAIGRAICSHFKDQGAFVIGAGRSDGADYEEIQHCIKRGNEIIKQINHLPDAGKEIEKRCETCNSYSDEYERCESYYQCDCFNFNQWRPKIDTLDEANRTIINRSKNETT